MALSGISEFSKRHLFVKLLDNQPICCKQFFKYPYNLNGHYIQAQLPHYVNFKLLNNL